MTSEAKKPAVQKTVLVVTPPRVPSKFLLVLGRFDALTMAGRQAVFVAIDRLDSHRGEAGLPYMYTGYLGESSVVAFPADTPFFLLDRALVRFVTPTQLVRYQKAVDKAVHAELGNGEAAGELEETVVSGDSGPSAVGRHHHVHPKKDPDSTYPEGRGPSGGNYK